MHSTPSVLMLLLSTSALSLLAACEPEKDGVLGSVSLTVDGQPYEFLTTEDGASDDTSGGLSEDPLFPGAFVQGGKNGNTIIIRFDETEPGTVRCSAASDPMATVPSLEWTSEGEEYRSTPESADSWGADCTIELDDVEDRLTGTFDGTVVIYYGDDADQEVTSAITKGRFDVPYE